MILFVLLILWITIDINYPFKTDLRRFDATETAKLEAEMWKSYYEKKPIQLFLESGELMRSQFHLPFWRSYLVAYYAAKAAFVFKDGKERTDYAKALPYLVKYYNNLNEISLRAFNTDTAAASELEWWILRRERDLHPAAEWEQLIAKNAATLYHMPCRNFNEYAHYRVTAMLLRDEKGDHITMNDWQQINGLLLQAWKSLSLAVNQQ